MVVLEPSMWACFTVAAFMSFCEPNACGGFLGECFACTKEILSVWKEILSVRIH